MLACVPPAAVLAGIETARTGSTGFWVAAGHKFPDLGKEFVPPLNEGSFLLMPGTVFHASIGECLDVLQKQDMAMRAIPERDYLQRKMQNNEMHIPRGVRCVFTGRYENQVLAQKG